MKRRVVITGIGVVTPVGNDVPTFWTHLKEGVSGIGPITKFDVSDYPVKFAAEVKDFDPKAFLSTADIRKTDGYQQYALGAAVQAAEDSGIVGTLAPDRLGVYVGSGIGGMETFLRETDKFRERGASRVSPFFITMMISNMAAGLIAIRFGAEGPTLPVVTACATSAHAVGEAFHAIADGYCDAIFAGGAEHAINAVSVAGFHNCMALSTATDIERASIPFDAERSGFVMGEGAAVLVLEEMEHAKARGAKIYAEVAGYGNTCDAYHVTAPKPDATGAARAIGIAVKESGVQTDVPFYINAHGTSTVMNDRVETLAIRLALGSAADRAAVSSTKSMTGHMLGAAGATEIAACALALTEGVIPPTIHYRVRDPECDLDYVPNEARDARLVWAASTSLGFGGHNACVVLRRPG